MSALTRKCSPSPGRQVSEMAEAARAARISMVAAGPRHLPNLPEGYHTAPGRTPGGLGRADGGQAAGRHHDAPGTQRALEPMTTVLTATATTSGTPSTQTTGE